MNRYDDSTKLRRHRVQVLLTNEEYGQLSVYRQNIRAPSLSGVARELLIEGLKTYSKYTQNILTFQETNNERKERTKEKEETNKELLSTSSTRAREDLFSWLTDNEETMRALCMREKITVPEPGTANELRRALQPFIDEFIDGLISDGEDLYLKTRLDTKHHFSSWLRKYKRLKSNETNDTTGNRDGTMDAERALQEYKNSIDWDAIKLRNHFE